MPEEKSFEEEFGNPEEVAPIEKQEADPTLAPESLKDRRHRRLEKALQDSREMNIALNERVSVLSETQKLQQEVGADADIHKVLFGDQAETPQSRATAQNLQRLLDKRDADVQERAFNRLQEASRAESREVQENASYLEDELESIEDRFNVDLEGSTEESRKLRNGFIDYVAKFSRKDRDGNIVDYPDIQATWEEFNARRQRSSSGRAQAIADRSMAPSAGEDAASDSQKKALEREWMEKGYI